MTDEEAAALVKSLVPPGPILIADSEKYREVLTDALVTIVARAVAAERERCLRIIREEVAAARVVIRGAARDVFSSLAAAIRRGE